jgi:hypothetical protein
MFVYSGSTGEEIWRFSGKSSPDYFGASVAGVRDVDLDGFVDVMGGGWGANGGGNNRGEAYVFSGRTAAVIWSLAGEADRDGFGGFVFGAGEIDDDGFADFGAIANGDDTGISSPNRTAMYLFSGKNGQLVRKLPHDPNAYRGTAANAGDVDGDGLDDQIVGIPELNGPPGHDCGGAFVYSGASGNVIWSRFGERAHNLLGYAVSAAGDLNGDGQLDVMAGAPYWQEQDGHYLGGRVYLLSGDSGKLLAHLDAEEDYARLGSHLAGAANLNADDYADFFVSHVHEVTRFSYLVRVSAYAGRPLFLDRSSGVAREGDLLELTTSGGRPADRVALFVIDPIFRFLLAGTFDATGKWLVQGPVPPGIQGGYTFRSHALDAFGRTIDSNAQLVSFE